MDAISEKCFPIDHLCLRSFLPRNERIRVPDSRRHRRPRHELVALELASHLVLTSFLFLTLAILVWLATWAFHSLNSVHPFPGEFLRFLRQTGDLARLRRRRDGLSHSAQRNLAIRSERPEGALVNQEIIRAIELGAMNALRLYLALLTAPYHISKAFVMRPMGEPFHWTWDNRVRPCPGDESGETGSAGIAAPQA